MNDWEIGKREIEWEHLGLFLEAYETVTSETFALTGSETPDFIGDDEEGRTVGIEITQLRFSPEGRHARLIFPPEPHDPDAWWRLLELMHQKVQTLSNGRWHLCERKILVIMLIDTSIEAIATGAKTDKPH